MACCLICIVIPFSARKAVHTQRLRRLLLEIRAVAGDRSVRVAVVSDQPEVEQLSGSVAWIQATRSRGGQIAAGIEALQPDPGDWVWILHADTRNIASAFEYLLSLQQSSAPGWGRFDVQLPGVLLVGQLMNLRSRLTKICTGDQGMFIGQQALQRIGGFPAQPLMEDIECSRRLKRLQGVTFHAPRLGLVADGSRWLERGWLRTVLGMWWYRIRYFMGASPEQLYESYYGHRADVVTTGKAAAAHTPEASKFQS